MGRLDRAYRALPVGGQNLAVSAFGAYWRWLRFGPGYATSLQGFRGRDRFTASDWSAWQRGRLAELLGDAAAHVPYYRRKWDRPQHKAAAAGRVEELPLLGKEPVRADPEAFCRDDVSPRGRLVFHTSGSTGTPIATIWTRAELRASMAVREARSAGWAGVSFRTPRATFSGRVVVPDPESRGPFHRYNVAERQVYLSAYHLRPDSAPRYVEALRRHGVRWLTGYAVSYYLLARMILEQGLAVPTLDAVVTTSEKLTPGMREVMEKAYGCRVFEEYGTVENVLFAGECERGRLHLSPDVGLVEILRPDGAPCDPGEPGEVVATCLFRRYQPMIRFRLGDVACWDTDPCPCGRAMPVVKEVVGRLEDVVFGPDGREMVRFHGVFVDLPNVQEGQVIQESLALIRVKVVPSAGYGPADADAIAGRVRQRLGPAVEVVVEAVEVIPRTPAGKFQAVVSRLASSNRAPG